MTDAQTAFNAGISSVSSGQTVQTNASSSGDGAAVLTVNFGGNNVGTSNFSFNSFQLENIGDKEIAGVFIDVSTALYADVNFDDETGTGGDDVSKSLQINDISGKTGFISADDYDEFYNPSRGAPGADPAIEALFADQYADMTKVSSGKAQGGYRGELLLFSTSNGGFEPGEKVGFSGDMDANSIAGYRKSTVASGAEAGWDVGGVSGAEMIGSTITVFFTDGSSAEGQLFSDGSQAGAQALISEDIDLNDAPSASLSVGGVSDGGVGVYGDGGPSVVVTNDSDEAQTIRVVMTRGFNPVQSSAVVGGETVADIVASRLQAYDFAVNNAADFQIVDRVIPAGGSLDISSAFDFDGAPNGETDIDDPGQIGARLHGGGDRPERRGPRHRPRERADLPNP